MTEVNNWKAALGATVKLARELRKASLRDFSKVTGVNFTVLHRIESGRGCDVNALILLHQATGIKYETMLGGKRK